MPVINPQPKDVEGTTIQGSISEFPQIQTFATTSGEWSPITLDYDECKNIMLQPRAEELTWYFSTSSGGTYFTIRQSAALGSTLVAASGTIICWVMAQADTTFELLIGR